MTEDETIDILALLQSVLPNGAHKTNDARTMEIAAKAWHFLLREYDFDVVQLAAMRILAKNKFMPVPVEVLDEVKKILYPEIGAISPEEAYGKMIKKVGAYGRDREDQVMELFDEQTREAVKAVGGWKAICNSEDFDSSVRARFCNAYSAVEKRMMQSDLTVNLKQALTTAHDKYISASDEQQIFFTQQKLKAAKEKQGGV